MNTTQEPVHQPQKAVIYCRVSAVAQVEEGHGLESQETRCREYAARKGYQVTETFFEKAISGGKQDRPSFNAMLNYVRKMSRDGVVIIIDDISRFARDIEGHWALRRTLKEVGGKLESPSIKFGEDSDSILIENLLASVSQHQRQKNGEQTKNRMRARIMNGYWVFQAPLGLKYQKEPMHGKVLVRDEPVASIIQEALEGFASGRFETQGEVKRFLDSKPAFPKDRRTGKVRYEEVVRILRRPHYAGYIEAPDWGVSLRKGYHDGLISFEDYICIQDRIRQGAKAPARKDISKDFPLRGFIVCGDCNKPLTANWSTSKSGKKHPYYMCFAKGCVSYRKSIRRDTLEGEFNQLVRSMQPTQGLFAIAKEMFAQAWEQRLSQAKDEIARLKREQTDIEKQIDQLLERIVETNTSSIINAYENKIAQLEKRRLVLDEKINKDVLPKHDFDQMFELAFKFLSKPWKLWASGQIHLQKAVLRLGFSERLAYCRKSGLRTPKIALPFNILGDINMLKNNMAGPEGLEPPTTWFEARYSIQLSYRPAVLFTGCLFTLL